MNINKDNYMLINSEVAKMIQEHVAREAQASNKYMAMALWCNINGYFGTEAWLRKQSAEETEHRNKMLDFLADLADGVTVPNAVEAKAEFKSLEDIFKMVLTMETNVSTKIHAIYQKICETGDFYTMPFWFWFLQEQTDSVRMATNNLARLKASSGNLMEFDEWIEEQ